MATVFEGMYVYTGEQQQEEFPVYYFEAQRKAPNNWVLTDINPQPPDDVDIDEIIPQDIGRVMLNLINNAFYAVSDRDEKEPDENYQPTVKVTTKKMKDQVKITVEDNGSGIPQEIKDKIFQPFFTTKPSGKGTGLGLSLTYDIITQGHGGALELDSEVGKGTVFTIFLPVKEQVAV